MPFSRFCNADSNNFFSHTHTTHITHAHKNQQQPTEAGEPDLSHSTVAVGGVWVGSERLDRHENL